MVYDLITGQESILLLGKPETGKKSVLREFARVLSELLMNRVLVVDPTGQVSNQSSGTSLFVHSVTPYEQCPGLKSYGQTFAKMIATFCLISQKSDSRFK